LTTSRARVAMIVVGLLLALAAAGWSGQRWEPSSVAATRRPSKVVVFGITHLGWDDLDPGAMPNLDHLRATGALGALTVRSLSARPGVTGGYATVGAGTKVVADDPAGAAYDAPTPPQAR